VSELLFSWPLIVVVLLRQAHSTFFFELRANPQARRRCIQHDIKAPTAPFCSKLGHQLLSKYANDHESLVIQLLLPAGRG
jgi:hypothetical protein